MEDSNKIKETVDSFVKHSKEFAEEVQLKENLSAVAEKAKEAAKTVGQKVGELAHDEELIDKLKDVSAPLIDSGKKIIDTLEENETVQKVTETVKETVETLGQKTQEYLERSDVQEKLEKAKDKTIELAESGVESLKKWLKPEDKNPSDEGHE